MGARSIRWRRKLQKHLGTAIKAVESFGYFKHRGIRIFHPGLLIDQPAVAEAIDASIVFVLQHSPQAEVRPLLQRLTLRYFPRPIRTTAGWVNQDARWTGGFAMFDRGVARVHYDEHWKKRTRNALIALMLMELRIDPQDLEDSEEASEEVEVE